MSAPSVSLVFIVVRCALSIVLALSSCLPVFAADIQLVHVEGGRGTVSIRGSIAPGDGDKYLGIVKRLRLQQPNSRIELVELDSLGGELSEAQRMARFIIAGRTETAVETGRVCVSACVILFMAGFRSQAAIGARIGVHRASEADGSESADSLVATLSMVRDVVRFGLAANAVDRLIAAGPDDVYWLTANDLRRSGVYIAFAALSELMIRNLELPPPIIAHEAEAVGAVYEPQTWHPAPGAKPFSPFVGNKGH